MDAYLTTENFWRLGAVLWDSQGSFEGCALSGEAVADVGILSLADLLYIYIYIHSYTYSAHTHVIIYIYIFVYVCA
jgi:hypothetical protein